MKVMMTVDPRLLKLLGDKLYSSHPLPIVVRELLQNARDACFRKGVKPDLRIVIDVHSSYEVIVTCTDNGIGMTEKQLVEDFLCLGNTSKMQELGAVGGFGIAKAAFMRNPKWSVHSLDNYMNESFLFDGTDIEKTNYLDGTSIQITITDYTGNDELKRACMMIYFSDVTVDLTVIRNGIEMHDKNAGWQGWELHAVDYGTVWEGYRIERLNKFGEIDMEVKCMTIMRLNGLVQYARSDWGYRDFNMLIELHPEVRPDDKNYPLTISREELAGDVRSEIRTMLDRVNANPLSTQLSDREVVSIVKEGYLMRGKRNMSEDMLDLSEADLFERLIQHAYDDEGNKYQHMRVYLENYDLKERNVKEDKKVLALWRELVVQCAEYKNIFGIGLVINPNIEACQMTDASGERYYLVNPDILGAMQSLEAKIHYLHMTACHETAHFKYDAHSEMHTVEQAQIYRETIDTVQEDMKRLKAALR